MRYIFILFIICFINFCVDKESNFEQQRKMELLLLYTKENSKSKVDTCKTYMSTSLSCLNQSKNATVMNEQQFSEKVSKDLMFSKSSKNYTELCNSYSSNFMNNRSKIAQTCTFECQKSFWDDQSCKTSNYASLYRTGFLFLSADTRTCIRNCYTYNNVKVDNKNLKELSTQDFFKLINE